MKPTGENILVKPFAASDKTEGGIIIPDSVKKPSNKVFIVGVGTGTKKKPMRLQAGQTGYRVRDWGQEIIIDGELYYIMNQEAIIALEE
jgi:chaperonin GroES